MNHAQFKWKTVKSRCDRGFSRAFSGGGPAEYAKLNSAYKTWRKRMLLAGAAFHKLPSAVVLVVGETVSRFAWPQYVVGAVLYTLIVFAGQFSREERLGPRVFSSQNAKPLPAILAVHILFLLAFLGCMWMASSRLAQMPVWMTAKDLFNLSRHGGEKVSLIELLLAVAAWVLRTIELPCVYGKSKTSGPVTFERP